MIQEILTKIEQSLQCILMYLLNLAFQPIYCILQMVQGILDVWEVDTDVQEEEQRPQVTQFPSPNEGKYAEDCDLPACGEHKIGYKINQAEKEELNKIKKELNK